MSDHAQFQELIAAAVADALTPEEYERLEAHALECQACATSLANARNLSGKLGSLFAAVRPGPALEDRVIQALRAAEMRRRVQSGWRKKLAVGIAASALVGLTGAGVQRLGDVSELPFANPLRLLPGQAGEAPAAHGLGEEWAASVAQFGRGPVDRQPSASGGDQDAANMAADLGERLRAVLPQRGEGRSAAAITEQPVQQLNLGEAPGSASAARNAGSYWSGFNSVFSAPIKTFQGSLDASTSQSYAPNSLVIEEGRGSVPAAGGRYGQFPAQADPSFAYVKPSDMKPEQPRPEAQRSGGESGLGGPGGKDDGKSPLRGARTVAEGKFPEQLVKPAAPAVPALPEVPVPSAPSKPEAARPHKIVIRCGEMEFEVESFDSAVAAVTRLVAGIGGAFVDTVNSEKLANGKVKGSVVVRVPPDRLDVFVLDLRKEIGKAGDLKGQRIGSRDITKEYTDLESRLRAARAMESRLLAMIKDGKGEIKQLLEAEKELGVWRTKIEEYEGELRYYGNLVALSTLTIALAEREIRAAAALTECERVQAGVEVDDVDKALQQAVTAIAESKGRVTKSELKQLAAGQFNATLNCELAPAAAGPFRDRLNQLGRVARLEIDRVQQSEGGTFSREAKVTRGDTQFLVQFYNLANVAPRETTTLALAVADVPAGYQTLREAVGRAHGRVIASRLEEQDRQNVTAQVDFEVRRADEPAVQAALAGAGEVVARNVTRAAEGDNLTDAKVLFRTALVSAARVKPRETVTLALEVPDVDAATAVLGAQVEEAKGRTAGAQAARERTGRVTARLLYDVPLSAAPSLVEKFKSAGIVRVQQSAGDPQAPDGRFATARLDVTLSNADLIVAKDDGLWPQVRRGLSLSVAVLLMSVTWVVFGLCVVLPWAAVGYGGYRLFRRLDPRPVAPPPAAGTSV